MDPIPLTGRSTGHWLTQHATKCTQHMLPPLNGFVATSRPQEKSDEGRAHNRRGEAGTGSCRSGGASEIRERPVGRPAGRFRWRERCSQFSVWH